MIVWANVVFVNDMKLDILSSDVMHGEGNLLAHLVIVGYKVSHQQVCGLHFNPSIMLLCSLVHMHIPVLCFNNNL